MWGFQLWVNLPAKDKMRPPRYQDIPPERIPEVRLADGVRVRIVAGESGGVRGPVEGIATQPLYLDVSLAPGARFEHPVPAGHTAFAYVFEGEGEFGVTDGRAGRKLAPGSLAVLGEGSAVAVVTDGSPVRFLLLAAKPLREPIARHGPFVMNTRQEIMQAIRDLEDGTFLD